MVEPGDSPSVTTDLSRFRSELSLANRVARLVWGWVWLFLFRTSPRIAFGWRRMLLRLFGAKMERGARVYPSTRFFHPANLVMREQAILGPDVDCYCVGPIEIGRNAMVSQYSYLCGATHDYSRPNLPLVIGRIHIGDNAWVCADVFIGPNVTVGEGSVVGARSTVFRDVPPWKVVVGNPPKVIRDRVIVDGDSDAK